MNWIADKSANRTYDPVAGLELFFISGGSDGSQSLKIRGDNLCLSFTTSLVDDPITPDETKALGLFDAGVWRVYGNWAPDEQAIIVAALSATKMGHGFSIRGEPYFVRFKRNGTLNGG